MDTYSITRPPLGLTEFRKLTDVTIEIDNKMPADSKSRRFGDIKGLLLYGCALICCLLCVTPFILRKSDIRRIFYETDWCGNFCGIKNEKIDGVGCSGKDYRNKPYSDLNECVELCPWGLIIGSYTCSQKKLNSLSVEMTNYYMDKLKEEQIIEKWQDEKQREKERGVEQPTVDLAKNNNYFGQQEKEQPTMDLAKNNHYFGQHSATDELGIDFDAYIKDLEDKTNKMKQEIDKALGEIKDKSQQQQNSKNNPVDLEKQWDEIQENLRGLNLTMPKITHDIFVHGRHRRSVKEDDIDNSDPVLYCRRSWWKFIVVIVLTIVLSIVILVMTEIGVAIWCGMACTLFLIILSTYVSWSLYYEAAVLEGRSKSRIIVPISATLFSVLFLITPYVRRKQFNLVASVFKETNKVVSAMPKLLIFIGAVTVVQFVVLALFILAAVQVMTTTELKSVTWAYYKFDESSNFAKFSFALLLFVANWTMQIFVGFRWMTVAGIVASWYFEEDGQRNGSIWKNVSRTFYHIGTIKYGSLFQPWMSIINHGLKFFTCTYGYGVCFFESVTKAQICLETYSKNAFIEAALHGQSFARSGTRAFNVLLWNAPGVIAINSLGSAVMLMNEVNVIVIATAISYVLFLDSSNVWFPTAISCIANAVIVTQLFGTFEIAMHTLSICFCEDESINGGNLGPYHASKELTKFVEKADELYVSRIKGHGSGQTHVSHEAR